MNLTPKKCPNDCKLHKNSRRHGVRLLSLANDAIIFQGLSVLESTQQSRIFKIFREIVM
jgi:hypothetical protein